jgi:hypothetical protein
MSSVSFRTVSEIEIFHCTVPKLLIRKIYYILFTIPVFIVHVTKLVDFDLVYCFYKNSADNINAFCNSCEDTVCSSSVQCTVK